MNATVTSLLLLWAGSVTATGFLLRRWWIGVQVHRRLNAIDEPQSPAIPAERSMLSVWLQRAGYRSQRASKLFIAATLTCLILGIVWLAVIYLLGVVPLAASILYQIPGGVGEIFLPLVWASPYIAFLFLIALPAVAVAQARKRRIQQVEQDLPNMLDLLSSLVSAGLSFDAATDRVLSNQPPGRPLAEEFRIFQVEVRAGRSRTDTLRRLLRRVQVPWFTIFISAMIQAEQIGAGLSETLRTQADDLRNRRRERALAFSMAIPVKLLGPLIICFLPGIMVAAIGPIAYQIVQVLDRFMMGGY